MRGGEGRGEILEPMYVLSWGSQLFVSDWRRFRVLMITTEQPAGTRVIPGSVSDGCVWETQVSC